MYMKVGLNFMPMLIFYHQAEYGGIMNKYINEDKSIRIFNTDAMELMDKMIEKV